MKLQRSVGSMPLPMSSSTVQANQLQPIALENGEVMRQSAHFFLQGQGTTPFPQVWWSFHPKAHIWFGLTHYMRTEVMSPITKSRPSFSRVVAVTWCRPWATKERTPTLLPSSSQLLGERESWWVFVPQWRLQSRRLKKKKKVKLGRERRADTK